MSILLDVHETKHSPFGITKYQKSPWTVNAILANLSYPYLFFTARIYRATLGIEFPDCMFCMTTSMMFHTHLYTNTSHHKSNVYHPRIDITTIYFLHGEKTYCGNYVGLYIRSFMVSNWDRCVDSTIFLDLPQCSLVT